LLFHASFIGFFVNFLYIFVAVLYPNCLISIWYYVFILWMLPQRYQSGRLIPSNIFLMMIYCSPSHTKKPI